MENEEGGGMLGSSVFIDLFALPMLERRLSSLCDGIDIDIDIDVAFDIFGQPYDFHLVRIRQCFCVYEDKPLFLFLMFILR